MKKGKKSKKPVNKVPRPSVEPIRQSKISRGAKIAWTAIVGLSTILALLALVPRISVSPSSNLDPAEPFVTPFIISNDGFFSVYTIRYNCLFNHVILSPHIEFTNMGFRNYVPLRAELRPTEKDSFLCSFRKAMHLPSSVKAADITLDIEFQNLFKY